MDRPNNSEMCDKLISDLNSAMKYLFNGQSIAFCDAVRMIAQMLATLKNGIEADEAERDRTIKELQQQIEDMGRTE